MLSRSPTKNPRTRVRRPNSKKRVSMNEVMKAKCFVILLMVCFCIVFKLVKFKMKTSDKQEE